MQHFCLLAYAYILRKCSFFFFRAQGMVMAVLPDGLGQAYSNYIFH
jgi:hypothetical protein